MQFLYRRTLLEMKKWNAGMNIICVAKLFTQECVLMITWCLKKYDKFLSFTHGAEAQEGFNIVQYR